MTNPWLSARKPPATTIEHVTDTNSGLPVESIQFELQKILLSKVFSHSSRHRDFLRFTVGEAIAGRGSDLKEYVIGVEVFHRQDSFDPHVSPLVRVAASRVRARLKAYYEGEGKHDGLLIELPKGHYAPVFRRRHNSRLSENALAFWLRRKWWVFAMAIILLLSMAGFSGMIDIGHEQPPVDTQAGSSD